MLPDPTGGKPRVATLGLSVEEAERHAITGPPDGRLARSITMSYTYPELEREANPGEGVIHAGLAVPLPGDTSTLGYLTVFTRGKGHDYADDDVRQLETLALRAGPAIENARRFREARQLADLDALTGLHNRRYFHEKPARECATSCAPPTSRAASEATSSRSSSRSRRSRTPTNSIAGSRTRSRPAHSARAASSSCLPALRSCARRTIRRRSSSGRTTR